MLREEVAATNADGSDASMDLFAAFLNPLAFGAGTMDHDAAAGAIVRGMTNQIGNEIDEFVTDVLRNQLLGIPLDLAALNIARGRDTGIPPLNEARRQFKEVANGDSQLDPYTSWADFALNLKNPASIVNFIAAYGTHASITSATTTDAKREAAWALVFGGNGAPADRLDFLNATGAYAGGKLGGLEDVDLWVGGMAEKKMAFGGMLGSTFSFVFELQLENLQNADRFYYLSRVQGLNFLNELENNSFAKMVLNNTDLGETGFAVAGDIFSTPDHVLYMDHAQQRRFGYVDPTQEDPWLEAISPMVERRDANGNLINPEDDPTAVASYIRVNTNDHVLIQGTNGNDTIIAGGGDDSVWGRDGNDRIEAGYGVDRIHGGKGDDIITNSGTDIGEVDMLHGEEGNDVIHAGSGLALVFGNEGQDFIITGQDGKEAFGGLGNDFILGGDGGDFLLGNEGDDWIEAGNGFDTTAGDNSELNFNSTILGHDVMFAGQNEHDFDAESGDDIMVQGESVMRNEGMFGYDWSIHKGNSEAADSDLLTPIFTTVEQDILRDRFDQVEALSGWNKNDVLKGDNRGDLNAETPPPGANGDAVETVFTNNELSQAGVNRIDGLRALLGDWVAAAPTTGDLEKTVAFDDGNILLGGGGSDLMQGRGGNDLIDGDRWLNVRIRITVGNETYTADGMAQKVYREVDYKDGAPVANAVAQFGGKTLDALMLDRTLNPGQLSVVREIVADDGVSDTDTAVYGDVRANYTISQNADGSIRVSHDTVTAGLVSDGVDKLFNIEKIRFADQEITLTPPRLQLNAFDSGQYADNFNTASLGNSTGATPWDPDWVEANDSGGVTAGQIRIDLNNSNELQFVGSNAAGFDGAQITRTLDLAGVSSATLSYSVEEFGLDANDDTLRVFFSRDGSEANFVQVDLINNTTGNATRSINLSGLGPFTANAAIRFVASSFEAGDQVAIDNLAVDFVKPANPPTVNHEVTFTEGDSPVAIASLPGIVEDTGVINGATIVLTNAQAGDVLNVPVNLPGNITRTIDTSVPGRITVTMTGAESIANYQAAIQQVTFGSNSQNPSTVDRTIQVTVRDSFLNSNVATSTIHVVSVNDAPAANNDSVFTNYTTAPFILPEWALLANDTDGEGATLDVTALSAINGLTASLTTNPGSVTLTDTGTAGGTFTYTANDGSGATNATDTANVTVTRDTAGTIDGNNGDNILIGDGGNSTLAGGEGNDLVFAGAGNDTVNWNARSITIPFLGTFDTTNDGRDFVDGGDGALDRFVVNGSGTAEAFVVYARASVPAGLAAGLKPDTEIVITRNGAIIAELDNIEEITINTGAGNDTVTAVGNFNPTSLNFNTITINGNEGDDTVDIAALQSAHRIVFRSNGGHDTIVGTLRQQDVIELPPGMKPEDFTITDNGNGTTSLVSASHKITYVGSGKPIVRECTEEEQANQVVATDDSFTVKKGEVLTLTAAMLIANDFDADGDTLSLVAVDEDEHGEAVLNADGTVTFMPKAGFTGTASFTYLVSDGRGNYDQGKVAITVADDTSQPAQPPVNQPPVVEQPGPATPAVPEDLVCQGGRGHDRLWGGDGHDRMYGDKGHDRLYGGGNDRLYGHDGNDRLCGDAGADRMWGGRGNDTYDVDDRGDRVHEGRNQGTDTVKASVSYSLAGTHVEKLVLTGSADLNGTGNSLDNTLTGNGGNNTLRGGGGHDVLKGGAGDDVLKGGTGHDRLTGGTGEDTFVFERGGGHDTVTDFRHGQDKIDVSGLAGVTSLSDLHLWQAGADTLVWHGSDVLVLKGVTASDLDTGDFIF
jgi:Ca2+-binding RTX toxin-like protein